MIRRQNRLRREFIYKKAQEIQDQKKQERKQQVKQSLDSNLTHFIKAGKKLPLELRKEAQGLSKEIWMDEHQLEQQAESNMDDEYFYAGAQEPKILITTSRDPSSRLTQFSKEMRLIFPNAQRMNRGNYVIKQIVEACRANECTDLIILHEHRGKPDGMIISHFPYGPTAYFSLHNVVLRHDVENQGTMSEAFPHLIFNKFNTKLGKRVENILKYLFPVPKPDSQRIMTFANENDYISFRHHVYEKKGKKDIELAEVGPRFEMKPYQIKLGTVDLEDAENEWVFRPYMRTSKKKEYL